MAKNLKDTATTTDADLSDASSESACNSHTANNTCSTIMYTCSCFHDCKARGVPVSPVSKNLCTLSLNTLELIVGHTSLAVPSTVIKLVPRMNSHGRTPGKV